MTTIQEVLDDGRLIRKEWSRVEDGRQLLCLYTALAGDPEARPEACPVTLCPAWLAYLLPWIDDAGSEKHWPAVVTRVAALADRLHSVSPETEWRVRALIVREAVQYGGDIGGVCSRVIRLCEQRGRGEPVSGLAFEAAEAAAWAAARSAVKSAEAAWSATGAAARSAARSAWAAAEAAAWSAESAAEAAGSAGSAEAADCIIDRILDEIERSLPA